MPDSGFFAGVLRVERAHVFVNVRQHVRRRFLGLAVKAEDRQLVILVEIKRHELARLGVAANAVLRPVKCDELHVRLRAEKPDDAVQVPVHAGRIGDQADAFAANEIEMFFKQDFVAGFDRRAMGGGGFHGRGLTAGEQRREKADRTRYRARDR